MTRTYQQTYTMPSLPDELALAVFRTDLARKIHPFEIFFVRSRFQKTFRLRFVIA